MQNLFKGMMQSSFVRFLVVGTSNTIISYLAFMLFLMLLEDLAYRAAASQFISYFVGVFWSYFWNRRWTFSGKAEHSHKRFITFLILQSVMAVLSSTSVGLLVDHFQFNPSISWFCVMVVITFLNYFSSKKFVFS